MSDYME